MIHLAHMLPRVSRVLLREFLGGTSDPDFVSARINDRSLARKKKRKGEDSRVGFSETEKEAFS